MKMVSLAMLVFTLAMSVALVAATDVVIAPATVAPELVRFIVADQVADMPAQPNQPGEQAPALPQESPSKRLSDSKGVVHPPPTGDHAVIKPPPADPTGKAVIPPPGTPGGDQSVQPK
jgi:hypothetical protein